MKDYIKGLLGVATPAAGIAVSRMDQVKEWLQLASLTAGFIVAVLSGISIALTIFWKLKHNKERKEDNEQ